MPGPEPVLPIVAALESMARADRARARARREAPAGAPVAPVGRPRPDAGGAFSGDAHVPGIDGVRGFAAALVLAYHVWAGGSSALLAVEPLRTVLAAGFHGVDVFFVVSGFVLLLPMARRDGDPGDLRSYAMRRVGRIVPLYLFALALLLLLAAAGTVDLAVDAPWESGFGLLTLLSHLTMTHNIAIGNPAFDGFGVLGVVWTLTLEACFYALLPFVARPFCRRPLLWLVTAVAATVAWRSWATAVAADETSLVYLTRQLPAYAAHFALGMGVAALWRPAAARLRAGVGAVAPLLVLAGTVGLAVALHAAGRAWLAGHLAGGAATAAALAVAGATAALVAGLACAPAPSTWLFRNRVARWAGEVSYGVYLLHMLVVVAVQELSGLSTDGTDAGFWAVAAVSFAVTYPAAWLTYRGLEVPARTWFRHVGARWAAARPAPDGDVRGRAADSPLRPARPARVPLAADRG